MKHRFFCRLFIFVTSALVVLFLAAPLAHPADGTATLISSPPLPWAGEKLGCQNVVTHHCQVVPETKQIKKTVYEVKEVPFCLKKLPPLFSRHRGCCADCPSCECPRYKKMLIKKEIACAEICDTKCVVEEGVKRVPCGAGLPGCSEMVLPVVLGNAGALRAAPSDHVLLPVVAPVLTR